MGRRGMNVQIKEGSLWLRQLDSRLRLYIEYLVKLENFVVEYSLSSSCFDSLSEVIFLPSDGDGF